MLTNINTAKHLPLSCQTHSTDAWPTVSHPSAIHASCGNAGAEHNSHWHIQQQMAMQTNDSSINKTTDEFRPIVLAASNGKHKAM